MTENGFYGSFARFGKGLLRLFSRRYRWEVPETEAPVVYLCRHLGAHGPLTTLKWCPVDVHPMVLHVFFEEETACSHLRRYTFSGYRGRKKPGNALFSRLVGKLSPAMMASLQAIPVHRDSAAIGTLKKALGYLEKGESVILYPDVEYTEGYGVHSPLYEGFPALGDLYFRRTGKPLTFVTLVIDDKARVIRCTDRLAVRDHRAQKDILPRMEEALNLA